MIGPFLHDTDTTDMRILMVGAGALGGYFGARLLAAGRDLTFLVRAGRAAQLDKDGLLLRSPKGDLHIPAPPKVLAEQITGPYDLVIVSCKAFDLDSTLDAIAPAVGPQTAVLPLLNGMAHFDRLAARFGDARVLGGLCLISAALDGEGRVVHYNDLDGLTFGERAGGSSPRAQAIAAQFHGAGFADRRSDDIRQELWEKWMFIASTAALTTLMRASVGEVMAGGGRDVALALVDECAAIAGHNGFAPRPAALERARQMLTQEGSPITASMYKDMARGARVEADQILGDLLARAPAGTAFPILRTAYVNLKTYEAQRH